MVVVVKVLVWEKMIVMLDDMEIIVAAVVIALEFVVPVLRDVVDDVLIDALTGVIIDVVLGVGVEVLTDVTVNACAAVLTDLVEFPMPTTLEEFSFWATIDCWPLAVLNCDRILQAWMPSYHV